MNYPARENPGLVEGLIGRRYIPADAKTRTHDRPDSGRTQRLHKDLEAAGAETRTVDEPIDFEKARNVVFAAPQYLNATYAKKNGIDSGIQDYPGEVRRAVGFWEEGDGKIIFTGSMGVYAEKDGGIVTETSPVQTGVPRCVRTTR